MPKPIKTIAIVLAAFIGLLAIGIGIFAATFDPNDYKPQMIRLVAEKKQRTLAIPGAIKLTFFPRLGADLGQVSLSEHNSKAEFASINQAKVSLALIPLLRKQLVVDRISIDGMQANIRRNKDGSTNFDDLLSKEEPQAPGEAVKFAISGVDISNAQIRFNDLQQQRTLALTGVDLETGKIANGVPSQLTLAADVKSSKPVIDARVAVKTGFTIDLEQQHYILRSANADIKGKLLDFADAAVSFTGDADLQPGAKRFVLDGVKFTASGKRAAQAIDLKLAAPKLAITDAAVTGDKLQLDAKVIEGARTLTASFTAPSFEGSPQAFKIPAIALDATVREGKLDATAKLAGSISGDIDKLLFTSPQLKLVLAGRQGDTAIDGSLSTPLTVNLKTQIIDLSNIMAAFALPNPAGGALKLQAAGRASINLGKSSLTSAFKGKLDESSFDARLGMASFSPAAYTFDIDIDRIDADRYLGKSKQAGAPPSKSGTGNKAAAEQPIDLSGLRDLRATGSVQIGALKVNNIKATSVRAGLRAGGGKIDVSSLSARLYGGSANGSLSATASNAPRFAVRQNLAGINIGPLLQDAIDKTPIEGRGNVSLDVTSAGGSFAQIKKSLDGTARLALQDGAVHGVNVAQVIRNAKAKIGELRGAEPAQSGTGSTTEKTDFSEMTGSFRITNGVARNDDLSVKSPLIRLGGAGDINLGEDRLDYLAKVTVVSTLQGQGGPELQALKGLTIPVRLSGPFTAIGWRVDFAGLAREAAREKIEEKKEELKDKAREKVREQLKGLFGK